MRTILPGPVALLAFLLLGGCAAQNPPRAAQNERGGPADPVDAYIHAVMEKNHVPGAAVAIVRAGKVEKMATYGVRDLESEAKVGPDTSFQIASATKVFTATLVMLLVQEGKLGLDDPISKYLPDAPEAWKAITVRHLAAHASGLKDDPEDKLDAAASVAARYEAAKKSPLAYTPGEKSEYALTDYVVLTHILETITGQRFDELLQSRIFRPLGFSCTRFEHATQEGPVRYADVVPRRATTYRFRDGAQQRTWYLYPVHAYAGGGAFSCIKDLARWAVAMDEGTWLTPETQKAAAAAFKLNDGRPGGYGVVFGVSRLRGFDLRT
jgi:CubicO group peptidase (beta-lactamase class C family)